MLNVFLEDNLKTTVSQYPTQCHSRTTFMPVVLKNVHGIFSFLINYNFYKVIIEINTSSHMFFITLTK